VSEGLLSVGLDVGTTSTQLIVSRLRVENRAGAFAVPQLEITQREILYRGQVHFTPLLDESHVDAGKLRQLVEKEYEQAGLQRSQVDTGAVIITGETSRKENARAVLASVSDLAGDFVVATAGPDLESVLAARGAGAVAYSARTGETVLHMDIGGGTANLALVREGEILETGCLNVGGRLLKLEEDGTVLYVSPVLKGLWPLKTGERASLDQVEELARTLTQALEMAAGLRPPTALLARLTTSGTAMTVPQGPVLLSFSGGVADCIEKEHTPFAFGDMGPVLGRAIRESALCRGRYRLGEETIRATVIGAGCHSAQLSGSTVYHEKVAFPLKNRPVAVFSPQQQEEEPQQLGQRIRTALSKQDSRPILAFPGFSSPDYRQVARLAEGILRGVETGPVLVALRQDMAKALGQALALRCGHERPILCIDGLSLTAGSYLDVGAPVGPAMPVVIKTLILTDGKTEET